MTGVNTPEIDEAANNNKKPNKENIYVKAYK
jgi:hypothetical protein